MRVLVLDGNENQAVACVRSLSRAGHNVSVGSDAAWSKAGWSKGCNKSFIYPSPQDDADAFAARIAEEAGLEPGTLVIPVTERSTLPLSARRDLLLAAGARIILPSHETVLRVFDKQSTVRLAESLGIAVPKTMFISDSSEAALAATTLNYPIVLKAASSEEFSAGKVRATGAPLYARNSNEFAAAYEEISRRSTSVLAQEYVEGEGAGYFALMREGELCAEFAHRRIRDVRPTGSGSSVRMSVKPDPRIRDAALTVLQALGWHGVAMVEFRIRPDGEPVFMEVNGRFWNSLALAVYSGADFPAMVAEIAERGEIESRGEYQIGVRCRWLLGDLRHLMGVWRGAPASFPGKYPGRLRTTLNFIMPVAGTRHDNFTFADPMPEAGDWIDFFMRRIPARLRKRAETRKEMHVERRYSHP
jgi:predicted ATP-grasp superfamily ATP-dependent carboligase